MSKPNPNAAKKNRPPRPCNMPWTIPYLTVRNAARSADFYEKAFGFRKGNMLADASGTVMHAEMHYQDMVVMFGPEGAQSQPCRAPTTTGTPTPFTLYFYVDDVDAAFQRAVAAGCKTEFEPADMFWGDRCAGVSDPDGYKWTLATNVADFDPTKVPK